VKVTTSWYETPVPFSDTTRAEVGKLLKNRSSQFIELAQVAAGEYQHFATEWSGPTPAEVRQRIEDLGCLVTSAEKALAQLPKAAKQFIQHAQALERSYRSNGLADLQKELQRLASACSSATRFKALNGGRGKTPDDARRHLIVACADAYRQATGDEPSSSSSGTFAKVMRLVLEAAGAKSGLSNDLLKSLQSVR
jgi:hypothetical protein